MADIVYTVDYDEKDGLKTSQKIQKIGSSPDRVRFVTNTTEYKMALERDRDKNPTEWAFEGIPDPYPIPHSSDNAVWIEVVNPGGPLHFHYICGRLEGKKFLRWPAKRAGAKPAKVKAARAGSNSQYESGPAPAQSLPFPT